MRITESRIRQIIREEAQRVLREGGDPRLKETEDNDIAAWKLRTALRNPRAEEHYPEARELASFIDDHMSDFDDEMAVIRPSKEEPDHFDIFLSPFGRDPINTTPVPSKILAIAGQPYSRGISSAGARRRHMRGF
jgi:hypothetical protein